MQTPYYDGVNYKYITSNPSTNYYSNYANNGSHVWQIAPSGTAAATITYTNAMTLDASGNLLVGTTDTTLYDNTSGSGINLNASGRIDVTRGDVCLNLNRNTSDGSIIEFRSSGTAVGSIRSISGDSIGIGTGDAGLRFVSGTNRIQPVDMDNGLNSDGLTSLGDTNKRFKNLYLSGGVVFGDAGGSGTSSSNTLDSYEEGTFTPTLTGGTSAGTTTYNGRSGDYTKIGNTVRVGFYISFTAATGTGEMRLGGLPFTQNADNTNNVKLGGVMTDGLNWDVDGSLILMGTIATTYMRVGLSRDDTAVHIQGVTNETATIWGSFTYITNS